MAKQLWLLSVVLSSVALAAMPQIPDLKADLAGDTLQITPPKGHHFNKEAPVKQSAGEKVFKPEVSEQKISTQLKGEEKQLSIQTTAYVCDDAKSYCARKSVVFGEGAKPGTQVSMPKAAEKAMPKFPGFLNDPQQAIAQAAKSGKPLLIAFSTVWCPSCDVLQRTVLETPEFKNATKDFVRVKLDLDHYGSAQLAERYGVRSIPTLVYATSGGDEILRVVGSLPLTTVLKNTTAAYAQKETGFEQLLARARSGDAASLLPAARTAMAQDKTDLVLELTRPALRKNATEALLDLSYEAQYRQARLAKDKAAQRAVLKKWIKEVPSSSRLFMNYEQFIALEDELGDKDNVKRLSQEFLALLDRFLTQKELLPRLQEMDYNFGDVHAMRADALTELGQEDEAKKAFLACAEENAAYAKASKTFARGPVLNRGYCLQKAGDLKSAEALYVEGTKKNPEAYVFYQRLGRLYADAYKRPQDSVKYFRQALERAYGEQRYSVVMAMSDALKAAGKTPEAIAALDRELALPLPAQPPADALEQHQKMTEKKQKLTTASAEAAGS